jgi:CRISPR-associated endonuclease/helicase Cas3
MAHPVARSKTVTLEKDMSPADFFIDSYKALRTPYVPMKWMERMFAEIIAGKPPSLVDLPTGTGKTELVIIWLLALAWYGRDQSSHKPVPRRLVWVVNRRVLVQQVFLIASDLRAKLISNESAELRTVRDHLRKVSGDAKEFLRIVELRGQIVQDRDWAIRPAVPQLIIGTVDQIGSRLLFQGYGLGKWGRPQHAGLLGVDSWVAVDEAHLVPAFVLTLRQLRERCASATDGLPSPFNTVFSRLPFWLTELSATPGMPHPSFEEPFQLIDAEKGDASITDRILAASSRRVQIHRFDKPSKGDKPKEILTKALLHAAADCSFKRVAVFVREVAVADKIATGLKQRGVSGSRICKITGRIRGYERDRLANQEAFKVFLSERLDSAEGAEAERFFLIGTAAAEVGLDADADVILCDFASLPTLLQRLGRLDRRGWLSRRWVEGKGEPPTMRVFAWEPENKSATHLQSLAEILKGDRSPFSAELMTGTNWLAISETKGDAEVEATKASEEAKEQTSSNNQVQVLINAATWRVLDPKDGTCSPPGTWLENDFSRIAAGPVSVPPVTDAVLDYWSSTTDDRGLHLSPHPFLYGLREDDEGTPLACIAFRLEVEALRQATAGDDGDPDKPDAAAGVLEIFERFPPLRAELHYVKLSTVREWLSSCEAEQSPIVFRKYDQWQVKPANVRGSDVARVLAPNVTLILPASVVMSAGCRKLIEECQEADTGDTAVRDVLDGVSNSARYRREIEPATGYTINDGAALWNFPADRGEVSALVAANDRKEWKVSLTKVLEIGGADRLFRYLRPRRDGGLEDQYLDDHNGKLGHLSRAEAESARLAAAIAPTEEFLRTMLSAAALRHDEGKRHSKWQRAFGRRNGQPEIAKLAPGLERPAPLHGFRHEWESLRRIDAADVAAPSDIPKEANSLWRDLLFHFVGGHHGHLRPSLRENGLTPDIESDKQNPLRLEAAERFIRLQGLLGRWRLAYLEALLKTADAEASRLLAEEEEEDEA